LRVELWTDIKPSLVLGFRILFTRVTGMKATHFTGGCPCG
jgi:hypothetical protein